MPGIRYSNRGFGMKFGIVFEAFVILGNMTRIIGEVKGLAFDLIFLSSITSEKINRNI